MGFSLLFSTLVCGKFSTESFKLKFYNTKRLNILLHDIDFLLTDLCKNIIAAELQECKRKRKA